MQKEILTAIQLFDTLINAPESIRRMGSPRTGALERPLRLRIAASQLSQLQMAKRATSSRGQKLLAEIEALLKDLQLIAADSLKIFPKYRNLADVYGMRSKLEWNAALRELKDPLPANIGARFLRGVTLRRLGDFEEAEAAFTELAQMDTPFHALFLAALAEAKVLQQETREAKRILGKLTNDAGSLPDINGYRGLVAVLNEDWGDAIRFWKTDLKNGGEEIPLRRNLAILLATRGRDNRVDRELALEHARLASQLSSELEWSVELSRAIVLFANQETRLASVTAEQASQLTSGECADYCYDVLDGFSSGKIVEWDFITH